MIAVESLMATPAGRDEYGTPDEMLERCEDHDVIYRVGGECLQCKREGERNAAGKAVATDGGEDR